MSEIKNDFIIDKTFKPKNGNGRIQLNANENGTPFFIQDLIPKNEKMEITFKNPSLFFGRKFLNEINLSAWLNNLFFFEF